MATLTPGLIGQIFRDRVERARRMSPEERIRSSLEHCDIAMEFMKSGVRAQYPDADENQVNEILSERFRLIDRLRRQS